MTARRVKSLHHNLGEGNVVFHREHRSKKNRSFNAKDVYARRKKERVRALKIRDIERYGALD